MQEGVYEGLEIQFQLRYEMGRYPKELPMVVIDSNVPHPMIREGILYLNDPVEDLCELMFTVRYMFTDRYIQTLIKEACLAKEIKNQ